MLEEKSLLDKKIANGCYKVIFIILKGMEKVNEISSKKKEMDEKLEKIYSLK
jgi:hypothetical protein